MTAMVKQKTARIEDAPGCMGSPTIRAVETEICKKCGFRLLCAKLAQVNRAKMEQDFGPLKFPSAYIQRPKIANPQPTNIPTGEKLSQNADKLRKELGQIQYTKGMMGKVIKTGEAPEGLPESRNYAWVIPALKAIHKGVEAKAGLRDILVANSRLDKMTAMGKAQNFLSLLLYWGLAKNDNGTIVKGDDL